MKLKKDAAKPLMVAQFTAEAVRLAGAVSSNQRRFLKAAASRGRTMEPVGPLAGVKA